MTCPSGSVLTASSGSCCSRRLLRCSRPAGAARAERVRADRRDLPPAEQLPAAPLLDRGLRVRLARGDVLPLDDLAAARTRSKTEMHALAAAKPRGAVTAGHFIFIPAVLLVGIVIGWILGSRAARDAYAAELQAARGDGRAKGRQRLKGEALQGRSSSSCLAPARSCSVPAVQLRPIVRRRAAAPAPPAALP